jgi:hypothetical protein
VKGKRSKDGAGGTRATAAARPLAPPKNRGRSDTADAFLPDPGEGPMHSDDDLAEMRGEDFLRAATTGEDVEDESMEQVVPEEYGGPFVETAASEEFAMGPDESNPEDAMAEPLPRAIHGLTARPRQ